MGMRGYPIETLGRTQHKVGIEEGDAGLRDTALDSKRGEGCCVRTVRSGSQPGDQVVVVVGGWRN